jgi:ferredoxin
MSKKDGKASLLKATNKKDIYLLAIPDGQVAQARITAEACPVRIIKVI